MKVEKIFKIFLVILVLGLALLAFRSIMRPEKFKMVYTMRETEIAKRLSALRSIQTVYKNEMKEYTANVDSLMLFVNSGTVSIIKTTGTIPEGMSEDDAFKAGLIQSFTVKVPAKEKIRELDPDITEDVLKVFTQIPESGGKKFSIKLDSIQSNTYSIDVYRVDVPLDDVLINMDNSITPANSGALAKFFDYLIYDGLANEEQYRIKYKPMWLGSLTESSQTGSWE